MEKKKTDAHLIQETHLAGDYEKFLINDFYGPESQPTNGKRGGVAIIFSPDMHRQWKQSGKAPESSASISDSNYHRAKKRKTKALKVTTIKSSETYASLPYTSLIPDIKSAK